MSMRLATAWLPATVLFAAMVSPAARAKPPELPVRQKITCQEKAAEPRPADGNDVEIELTAAGPEVPGDTPPPSAATPRTGASLMLNFEVNSSAGFLPAVIFSEAPTGETCSRFSQIVGACWNLLGEGLGAHGGFMGVEVWGEVPLARVAEFFPATGRALAGVQKAAPAAPTCPYLRQKEAAKAAPVEETATVLDNLHKLEAAHDAYQKAEAHRRHGRVVEAFNGYKEVCKVCPGSRYDRLAAAHLDKLQTSQVAKVDAETGEEQETPPAGAAKPTGKAPAPLVHCRFRLTGLNMALDLNETGHGSLSFGLGMESTVFGLPWQLFQDGKEILQSFGTAPQGAD